MNKRKKAVKRIRRPNRPKTEKIAGNQKEAIPTGPALAVAPVKKDEVSALKADIRYLRKELLKTRRELEKYKEQTRNIIVESPTAAYLRWLIRTGRAD